MSERPTTSTQGILRPRLAAEHIDLRRFPAANDVGRFVERYWAVHWDLRGREPYQVELIPHPCVNISFTDAAGAEVHGVGSRTSAHPLAEAGRVFGIKFRPGGFHALTGISAAPLTDRTRPIRDVFGTAGDALGDALLAAADDHHRRAIAETFLRDRLPPPDSDYDL
ncbi:MAG: DUF6597 domain-containing transcriptional factor, partial [Jiangellaceae bacterium]